MDNPIPMTRAELEAKLCEIVDWKCPECGQGFYAHCHISRPGGRPLAYQLPRGHSYHPCLESSLLQYAWPPDFVGDIAKTWWLKDWLFEDGTDEAILRWLDVRHETNLAMMRTPQAIEWICCTVYWAVEGKRVQIVGGEGDGA